MPTMVNDTLDAIFIHIPKSAGSTVTHALNTFCPASSDPQANAPSNKLWVAGSAISGIEQAIRKNDLQIGRKVSHPNHSRAVDIRDAIGRENYDGKYSFTFVRNPFDRIASTYHYIRRNPENPKNSITMDIGFEQYIVYHCLLTPSLQADWICDAKGEILVKDVFRVEDMGSAGDPIGRRLYGEPLVFGQVNTSANARMDKSGLWNDVPDWVIRLFLETFAPDFEKTGYSANVDAYKNADTISDEARNGAWERLWPHMLQQLQKLTRRNRHLELKVHAALEARAVSGG